MSVAVSSASQMSNPLDIGGRNQNDMITPPSSKTSSLSGDDDDRSGDGGGSSSHHQTPPDNSTGSKEPSGRGQGSERGSTTEVSSTSNPSATKKVKIELPNHRTVPKSIKSATLNIFGNNSSHSSAHSHSLLSRTNNLRRSFTLPRGLFPKKSSGSSPVSENINGNFVRNIFLTLTRRRPKAKGGGGKGGTDTPLSTLNNDNSTILPNSGFPIFPPDFMPGAIGLKNQGNTCYANAIVQCLSHTDSLARYLVTDDYKRDLKKKHIFKNGKGEITEELAQILRCTWLRLSSSVLEEASTNFKSAVEKGATQWRGAEQHDAQEFLLWLLDRLHEDLNQGASNKYKILKNNFGRPDEQVAGESWQNHLRCNTSIIQDLFGAQFRSSLTCPGCSRQSATFDPFLCVSLPIPQAKQEVPVYVNVVYLSQQPRQVKLGLSVSASADIKELKQLLAADTNIEENEILLFEVDGEGFHRTFTETQLVSVLSNNEAIYCIETPTVREVNENDGAFLLITWTNLLVTEPPEVKVVNGEDPQAKKEADVKENTTKIRFGSVYVTQIARETGYIDLQKILLKEMAAIIQPGILVSEQKSPVFSIRVLDGSSNEGTLMEEVDHPLYSESVDHALSLCDEDVPSHIKIQLEWKGADKDRIIFDEAEHVEEHSSVAEIRARHSSEGASTVTLSECFELYTRAEELSAEDSWHCPHCNKKEEGTLKMIGLWSAPQVLVVHLKRFRQTTKGRGSATKISSVVEFPIENLDIHPHVSRKNLKERCWNGSDGAVNNIPNGTPPPPPPPLTWLTNGANGGSTPSPMNGCFGLGSWKRASFKKALMKDSHTNRTNGYYTPPASPDNFQYDLFAVCNHIGKDVQGGHYTAFCKNPVDGSWWSFDDTKVSQLESPAAVKTSQAYILFYQKRPPPPPPVPQGHWCRNLIKKYHKFPLEKPKDGKPITNGVGEMNGKENGHSEHVNGINGVKEGEVKLSKSTSTAPIVKMEDLTSGGGPHELQIESTV